MDINREAPVIAVADVDVSAAPESVWQLLADVERWPTWNPDQGGSHRRTLDGREPLPVEGGAWVDHVDHPSRRAATRPRLDRHDLQH